MLENAPSLPRLPNAPRRPRALTTLCTLAALALCCGLLGVGAVLASVSFAAPARSHAAARAASTRHALARAHASRGGFLTGIGDEQAEMFGDPNWQRLHTKVTRYIAPYDAAVRSYSLDKALVWIHDAEAQHQQILVSFYHSEYTPTRMPSVAAYQRDVQRFVKLFPHVRQYQPWDEANRGYIPHALASPTAVQSAQYYQALRRVCRGCTVVGLDVLDQQNVGPTLAYIAEFKHEIAVLHTVMPSVWGLHNYSDTNRRSSLRTRAVLAAVPGQVWLTETGGIVQFGGAFPNARGAGLRRAASALSYMFALAGSSSRITRLYIYDWSGGNSRTRFDAGLTDSRHRPRAGYVIVCRKLHASGCASVKISSH